MIEVKNLSKKYGSNTAVSDLSFTIGSGQIYGFLGPNGAGKTTTLNMLTGCIASSAGEVLINGMDILKEPIKAKRFIGYLPEQPPLYSDMTPYEYLLYIASAKGLKGKDAKAAVEEALVSTDIAGMRSRLIKYLSKGYRQRVGFAQALIGEPEYLILDEPMSGLDPLQIVEMREVIKQYGKNHTVLLSSHNLSEISSICNIVMIISKGRLVASDTPEKLSKSIASIRSANLRIKTDEKTAREVLAQLGWITRYAFTKAVESGAVDIEIESDREDFRELLFFALCERRIPIIAMTVAGASLEDVFIELTNEEHHPFDENPSVGVQHEDGDVKAGDDDDNNI